jgi:D-alanine transaminase
LADGVYEVARSYRGRFFELQAHLARMEYGLHALQITGVDPWALGQVAQTLLETNGLQQGDASVYFQVTRGVAPRVHHFPDPPVPPTVYLEARKFVPKGDPAVGTSTVTVPDMRWSRCDIKSIAILANCLANQRAHQAGAVEAILVRDGVALEGSAASFFVVMDGEVRTAPRSNYILGSITRDVVLRLCAANGIPARETPVFVPELEQVDEMFFASTTIEILPIIEVDGRTVGAGKPGPVTKRLIDLFSQETHAATI